MILHFQYWEHLNDHVHIFSVIIYAFPNIVFNSDGFCRNYLSVQIPFFSTTAEMLSVIFILSLLFKMNSYCYLNKTARKVAKLLFQRGLCVCASDSYNN